MRNYFLLLVLVFVCTLSQGQSLAWKRANKIGKGMNLTWMDQRWNGSEAAGQSDYLNLYDLPEIKAQIILMNEMGYTFLRFPVCFDVWYGQEPPYKLLTPKYYAALDSVVKWTKERNMMISIDYHHGKIRTETLEEDLTRICAIWKEVCTRYKSTDPERVFFEIFNEPSEVSDQEWWDSAEKIISTIRSLDQQHTLIVGAARWNGLDALMQMPVLADTNLIYTFHFYDPFLFTHQGAEWAGDAASTTGMPYPYNPKRMPVISDGASSTWAAGAYSRYDNEATYEALFARVKRIKDWSIRFEVPIFCGEWGAYSKYPDPADRCKYYADIYTILDTLKIPNAMWEWRDGFSYFNGTPSPEHVSPCMKAAVRLE